MISNLEAAQSNDRRAALVALRDTLAEKLDTTEANIHAQLAAQYRAVLDELAVLNARPPQRQVRGSSCEPGKSFDPAAV